MNDCLKILSRVLSSIEFCILVVYFHDKLYKRKFSNYFYIIYLVIYTMLSIFVHLFECPIVNVIFSASTILITSFFYYQNSYKKIFIHDILLFIVLLGIEMIVSAIFGIFNVSLETYLLDGELLFISSIVILIFNICSCKILIGKLGKYKWQNIQWLEVLFSIILCIFETVCIIYLAGKNKNDKSYALLFFGVGYFLIICYQLYANHIMQLFYEKERKQELEENNKKMLDKHYEMIEEKNRRYRKLEHDIYKHLNTLEVLSQGKDRDVISNYIMEIKEQIANLEETFILKNKVLQILVNGLYKKASNDNILCRFDIVDMDLTFLNSYDLTTLFGNLLDNAYEACLSVDEKQRFIYMHLYRFNNFIILCICNSYRKNENTNLFGSHIVFKESDKGIGLNNVTDVINKYNGQMEILRKQEEFEVRIVLPIS